MSSSPPWSFSAAEDEVHSRGMWTQLIQLPFCHGNEQQLIMQQDASWIIQQLPRHQELCAGHGGPQEIAEEEQIPTAAQANQQPVESICPKFGDGQNRLGGVFKKKSTEREYSQSGVLETITATRNPQKCHVIIKEGSWLFVASFSPWERLELFSAMMFGSV